MTVRILEVGRIKVRIPREARVLEKHDLDELHASTGKR